MIDPLRLLADEFLRSHAVRTDGPFTLRSGEVSDWYLDARVTTFDGAGSLRVADAVLARLDAEVTAIGGMTIGADPIAVATAGRAAARGRALRAFSIRKSVKTHGRGDRVVGPLRREDRVAVVEDTTTTGAALEEAIDVVEVFGADIIQALALVDRSGGAVASRMASRGIPYVALLTPTDLGVEDP